MEPVTAISFLACTLFVAIVSWYKTRLTNLQSIKGVFQGGKNNNYLIVGGSLLLTNLSANQFIGENESVYINNMSVMAWGITSVLAILLVSEFLFPIYFKRGMITTPDFLSYRYDEQTKRLVSIIFIMSYATNLLPPVLYGGAIAMTGMFNLHQLLGLSYWSCIWLMVWILGLIGSAYTILGGLKAITISDSVLGGGMLLIGICLPLFALYHLGGGNFSQGFTLLLSQHTDHLNAIGSSQDAIPFSTIFTGMLLVNLYYWGMEQYIVQQALAAKNLQEAQKGMALTALGKLFTPVLINIPGVIAVHLYPNLTNTTLVFPSLVADVLPPIIQGITGALVFGAAMTTYNAGLHGSSTLFVLNIYKPSCEKKHIQTSEKQLVRISKRFELILSLFAMFTAPFILFAPQGFYTYLQQVSGLFSLPVFTIIVVGVLHKKISPLAAKTGLLFFMSSYFICIYLLQVSLHFLHVLALLFILTIGLMLVVSFFKPAKLPSVPLPKESTGSPEAPWALRHWAALFLLLGMAALYWLFSPLGLAGR